jgi:hypothetical protein
LREGGRRRYRCCVLVLVYKGCETNRGEVTIPIAYHLFGMWNIENIGIEKRKL